MRSSRLLMVAGLLVAVALGSAGPALAWTVGSKYVAIPCTTGCGQQDYNNWCGVASSHAVLHKLGKNISQATLASKYGVGKADGSAVAIEKIPGVLNGYVAGFDYVHVKRTDVNSASLMASIAQFAADNGYLGIPCVNPYPVHQHAGADLAGSTDVLGHITRAGTTSCCAATTTRRVRRPSTTGIPHYDASHYGLHSTSASTFWKCLYYKNWGSQGVVY